MDKNLLEYNGLKLIRIKNSSGKLLASVEISLHQNLLGAELLTESNSVSTFPFLFDG